MKGLYVASDGSGLTEIATDQDLLGFRQASGPENGQ